MNGSWSVPRGGSATGATIMSFRVWQLYGVADIPCAANLRP